MLLPEAMLISMVHAATQGHVGVHGLATAVLMSMAHVNTEADGDPW